MNITILNANHDASDRVFDTYIDGCVKSLQSRNYTVKTHPLREMKINYCTGCWSCWSKTPGRCKLSDDMETIYPSIIRSRLLILAAPLVLGFPSSLLKKVQDRLIPLICPFLLVINREFRHERRYSNHPALGLLYQKEYDTDEEDIEIVTDIYSRLSLNFQSRLLFSHSTDRPIQEMIDEISCI